MSSKKNLLRSSEKGSALVTVLVFLLIFSVLTASVMVTTSNNLRVSKRMSEFEDLYYSAESGVQYAMTFIKEQVAVQYGSFYEQAAVQDSMFLSDLSALVTTSSSSCKFIPMNLSSSGISLDTTIEQIPGVVSVTGPDNADQVVTYKITCTATDITSSTTGVSRTVYGELSVSNPRATTTTTTTVPSITARVAAGGSILAPANPAQDNMFITYSDIVVGTSYPDQYDQLHSNDHFSDYNLEVNSYIPDMLNWELEYSKFPPHEAFKTYEALYDSYSSDADAKYTIQSCAHVTEAQAKAVQSVTGDYPSNISDLNTSDVIYVDGNVNINDNINLQNEYIVASGDIYIDIDGYIRNCIFISTGGSVYISCRNITNDSYDGRADHKLISAYRNVTIFIDDSGSTLSRESTDSIKNAIITSARGYIIVNDYDTSSSNKFTTYDRLYTGSYFYPTFLLTYNKKITVDNCYFYSHRGWQSFDNVFFDNSYINSRDDVLLDNCSGNNSSFYAGKEGTLDCSLTLTSYLHNLTSGSSFYRENYYNNCDLVADTSIYLGTRNNVPGGVRDATIKNVDCRFIAHDYVYIYACRMYDGYVFSQASPTDTTDGIFIYTIQEFPYDPFVPRTYIFDTIMYSREDIYYYQNTQLEHLNSSSDIEDVKYIYNTLFYCKGDFIYDGQAYTNMTQAADPNKNSPDMLNDMYIMCEEDIRPANDDSCLLVVGKKKFTIAEEDIIVNKVHSEIFGNYFEQETEVTGLPTYVNTFVYEDIYEKSKTPSVFNP